MDLFTDNRDRFTDEKYTSRTIRVGFMDRIVVITTLGILRKDTFSCPKAYIRGTFANLHLLLFVVHTSISGSLQLILYMFEDIFCWHTALVKSLKVLTF